ncbi:MAG: hypothetical protein RR246_03460 [Clostridia bacterium]
MGDKSIKKETKQPKKSSKKSSAASTSSVLKPVASQPELIKKERKIK